MFSGARIRVYPTEEQEREMLRIAGCCRLVYNLGLAQRRDFWRQMKRGVGHGPTWFSQKRELTALRAEHEFLRDCPVHCLQSALRDLDAAFVNFWEGRADYPTPRKRDRHVSFRFPDPAQIRLEVKESRLVLPKFGKTKRDHGALRAVFHRPLRGRVRSVTIVREGAKWFASVLMRTRAEPPVLTAPITPEDVVGVDRNIAAPAVTSEGELLGHRITTPAEKRKRRRLAKAVSRTRRGSRRSEKAKGRLRAFDAKRKRRRQDMTHQITAHLAKNHRVIVIENLDVRAMTASARGTAAEPGRNVAQKSGLNRSILDVAWGEIRRQLLYKLRRAGGVLIEVSARDTSRTCGACRVVDVASRVSRDRFVCVRCGHAAHADVNAAIEIRRRGLIALGLTPAGTVGDARGAPIAIGVDGAVNREQENDGIRSAA